MNTNQLLKEMRIAPIWRLRSPTQAENNDDLGDQYQAQAPSAINVLSVESSTTIYTEQPVQAESISPAPQSLLSPTQAAHPTSLNQNLAQPADDARARAIAQMDWQQLAEAVQSCRACRLCEKRKQAVLGVGDPNADWLFVGEGPGAEEDAKGEPFVGQAGKLLDAMLAAVDLKRGNNVYIANTVKCRPPNNRTPEADEMAACLPFLERQIELLQPKLMIALGRPAAQTLIGQEIKIGAARGHTYSYRQIPLLVTYHPAYLLRNLPDKARAWEDLCFARDQFQKNSQ